MSLLERTVHEFQCYLCRNKIILNNLNKNAVPKKVNINWYKMENQGGGTELRRLSVSGHSKKMCGVLWY